MIPRRLLNPLHSRWQLHPWCQLQLRKRLNELEAMFRQQHEDSADYAQSTRQMAQRLEHIDKKLGQIDSMDTLLHQTMDNLNDASGKLFVTIERQQDSHVQILDLSIRMSWLADFIDRMASRIEVLTTIIFKDPTHLLENDSPVSVMESTIQKKALDVDDRLTKWKLLNFVYTLQMTRIINWNLTVGLCW